MFKNVPKTLLIVLVCAILVGAVAVVANLSAVSRAAGEAAVIGKVDGVRLGQEFPAMQKAVDNILKQKAALEKELNTKAEGQDQETQRTLLDQYNLKYNEYAKQQLEPAENALKSAIAAVAKEKGVTVVLDSSVVHLGGIDMTEAVLKKGGAK